MISLKLIRKPFIGNKDLLKSRLNPISTPRSVMDNAKNL
jgi:hypothetical protein